MSELNVTVTVAQATPVNVSCVVSEEITVEQNQVDVIHSSNHASLNNLDYENSGHSGFQKELQFDEKYKCYLI